MCISQIIKLLREDRTWPVQCRRGVVTVLLAGAIAWLSVCPTPSGATPASTAMAPILPGICSESDRFGLVTTGAQVLDYDVGQLHAGWYVNFTALPSALHPADMAFAQMVRLSDDGGDGTRACLRCPTWDELTNAVQTNPGAVWLIGNEPDSQTIQQDNVNPCRYAQLYKEIYEHIKGVDPTSLVGMGGIVQPTPIRIEYLGMILDEYQAQFGEAMPVDVWNVHNYVLREKRFYGAQEGSAVAGQTQGSLSFPHTEAMPAHTGEHAMSPFVINEIDSDTPGNDSLEFVEIYDGGIGNTVLNGLVVVFYDGSTDRSYFAADLDSRETDAKGYFLLGNAGVSGVDVVFPNGLLQNGPDAVAIYEGDASDFPANSPVTAVDLIDAVVYGTADADDPGLLPLLSSCQPQVDESRRSTSESDSSQRCPNGTGAQRTTGTIAPQLPTPGSENCQDECQGCWGAGIPPSIDADTGILYEIADHLMLDPSPGKIGWKQQLVDLRTFMAERGYRSRPLIVSEYGNLMPVDIIEGRFDWEEVGDFFVATSNWLLQTTDPSIGCPGDGNRLVQAWAWWPFDFTMFGGYPGQAHLFDPNSHELTAVGLRYAAYTQSLIEPHPYTVDLRVVSVQHLIPARVGHRGSVILTADIANRGAIASGSFQVEFRVDGSALPRAALSSILPGQVVPVQIPWEAQVGDTIRVEVSADPDGIIVDCDPYNNYLSAKLWLGDHGVYLPLIGNDGGP